MKHFLHLMIAVLVVFFAAGFAGSEAEAARFGGSRSFGMQRQSISPRPLPSRQIAPSTPSSPSSATTPRRSWLGPLGGLAAGLGLGALLSHFGLGQEFGGLLMLALLVMGVMAVSRMLQRRPEVSRAPMQYAGAAGNHPEDGVASAASASAGAAAPITGDFDTEAFLRVAKLNFVRLQAANDAKNLDDIREFTTPEVFAEIKMQMTERGDAGQKTDVVTLNAELLELLSDGPRHIASVRFNGMVREGDDSPAMAFDEIWHLSKPVDGSRGWVIAGIQQTN